VLLGAAALVLLAAKKGETTSTLSGLVLYLASLGWSARILAGEGDVVACADSPIWVLVFWILPCIALAANIIRFASDQWEAVLVSGAIAATASMTWCLLAPLDVAAVSFSYVMPPVVRLDAPRAAQRTKFVALGRVEMLQINDFIVATLVDVDAEVSLIQETDRAAVEEAAIEEESYRFGAESQMVQEVGKKEHTVDE